MTDQDAESELINDVAGFHLNPLGFVKYAFPWGEGELEAPRAWQVDILNAIGKHLQNPETRFQPMQIAVASGHGIGKALMFNSLLPTPNGDRQIKDIRPGDYVYGSDGQPVKVLAWKTNGLRPVYKVTFDDGSFVLADENHDWLVQGRRDRERGAWQWHVKSTKVLLAEGLRVRNGDYYSRLWEIPLTKPVHGSLNNKFSYALGAWLGDGTRRTCLITKPSKEIFNKIIASGLTVTTSNSLRWFIPELLNELRRLGISELYSYQRFLPDEVWKWTPECRMELLRGLLDTDGTVTPCGSIGFTSTSPQLANGVIRLARSLGFTAKLRSVRKSYLKGKRYRDAYNVKLAIPASAKPFCVPAKAERLREANRYKFRRRIDSIERVDDAETICIEVDAPDHLYLANDYIVTHNSALIGQISNWALSTMEDTRIIITANTDTQLKNKTMPEISRWFRASITSHWFQTMATAVYSTDMLHLKSWRADAVPWSDHNTEAFAGLHNKGKRILVIFDEASAISDKIWEVTEGALTDEGTEILWLAFGNPTRNSGRFRQCFSKYKHLWVNRQIDSSKVEGTNKVQIQKWIETYGEDSDFVRVRVKGKFPRASSMQFIDSDLVSTAQTKEAQCLLTDPLIMALDIARGGSDNCVIRFRRGLDARSIPAIEIPGSEVKDSMRLVSKVIEVIKREKPDVFFYDGTGVGGPVGDRIRQLGYKVVEVQFGSASPNDKYANLRAYMWAGMKEWLITGGAIDDNQSLEDDLNAVEYGHNKRDQLLLESKESMKARGIPSPDHGDALAMTFAYPVPPKDLHEGSKDVYKAQAEYDPWEQ